MRQLDNTHYKLPPELRHAINIAEFKVRSCIENPLAVMTELLERFPILNVIRMDQEGLIQICHRKRVGTTNFVTGAHVGSNLKPITIEPWAPTEISAETLYNNPCALLAVYVFAAKGDEFAIEYLREFDAESPFTKQLEDNPHTAWNVPGFGT